jgi:predicted  nucleic acid-binding Zn-ribbon protein
MDSEQIYQQGGPMSEDTCGKIRRLQARQSALRDQLISARVARFAATDLAQQTRLDQHIDSLMAEIDNLSDQIEALKKSDD